MENIKQFLISELTTQINAKKRELGESDSELEVLQAKLKVENKVLEMTDIKEELKEDFKCLAQVLGDMIIMEQKRNSELKKDLDILIFRSRVIESQFSENELD